MDAPPSPRSPEPAGDVPAGDVPPRRRGRPANARPGEPPAEEQRVEAVERALAILEAFDEAHPALPLAGLAQRTGLYPSTILRLAASLIRFGYLHRGEDGRFRLGPAPLRLGLLYRESFRLTDYVRPALARLAAETGETAAFYVREGRHRVCLYRHVTTRLVRHHVEEGAVMPLDRGAGAHVLTAFTSASRGEEAVRRRGYAISFGERDPEAAAIAAPVFGEGGRLVGAVGVAGVVSRFREGDVGAPTRAVVEAARGLTRELGGTWPNFDAG